METTQSIRIRADIDARHKWRFSDIFPGNEAWEEAVAATQQAIVEIPALARALALKLAGVEMETSAPVHEALDWFEEILGKFEKASGKS